jgi:sulfur-oxidizing protein SoxA
MKTKTILAATLLSATLALGGEQFAMSDADRALYAELLENNPAEMDVEWGGEML